MADPFVAEIRVVGFNFAPKGWAFCNGQLLPLSQNTALFSLLGTVYGGDGKSTFALPNIEGSVVNAPGQGPGLSLYDQGQVGGTETVTLNTSEIPLHTHLMQAVPDPADQTVPSPVRAFARSKPANAYQTTTNANIVQMAPETIAPTGGSFPHNNMAPYLTLSFVIALQGVFPPRG
jgi:microcystin-dependent protein